MSTSIAGETTTGHRTASASVVTVAIPGTTKVEHLEDNLGAARGRLPDAAMRRSIEKFFDAL